MRKVTLALAAVLTTVTPAPAEEKASKRPNFVIFIADDVGCNDIGCYGNKGVRTPNIDRLAKEGLRFDSAFLTCSSCSPSRCSILTGRYPHSTGAAELHVHLPKDQTTFAKLLCEAGYHTASAGKWHLGPNAKTHFDRVITGGRPSGCEHWMTVLSKRPKDKPFFLWLAASDAHRPYAPKAIDKPHRPEDVFVPPFLPDAPEVRRDLALYYDEITRMDRFIGEVLKELDDQGVAKNTLVLFMTDNGRPFPRCKTTVYDSGVKTPFVLRWPGKVKPGGVCKGLVSSIDIAPTFLELAGLKPSPTFQGKSFAKLLSDPDAGTRDYVFAEHNWHDYQAHERSVRSRKYLYIRNAFPQLTGSPPADAVRSPTFRTMLKLEAAGKLKPRQRGCFIQPRPKEELYDVEADPFNLKNLADDPKHAEALKRMGAALDEWIKETGDKVPQKPTPDKFDRKTGERQK